MSIKANRKSMVAVVAVALAAGIGATAVWAQQINPGVSCLEGKVGANDYAEFSTKYEAMWDSKAAVRLVADSGGLELKISNTNGSEVCEDTADMKTLCVFKEATVDIGTFTFRIDNKLDIANSRFRLCAE